MNKFFYFSFVPVLMACTAKQQESKPVSLVVPPPPQQEFRHIAGLAEVKHNCEIADHKVDSCVKITGGDDLNGSEVFYYEDTKDFPFSDNAHVSVMAEMGDKNADGSQNIKEVGTIALVEK